MIYTYSIANDTANGLVHSGRLHVAEIATSAIVEPIAGIHTEGDVLDIEFPNALSAGDKTVLDGIVAAHDGTIILDDFSQEQLPDVSTTATKDSHVPGMTISPPIPGKYAVVFTGSVMCSAHNAIAWPSLALNGTQVPESERECKRGASQGEVTLPFSSAAVLTLTYGDTVQGCWRVSRGTATMKRRTISYIRLEE